MKEYTVHLEFISKFEYLKLKKTLINSKKLNKNLFCVFLWVSYPIFGVLGMGFGCGYEARTQNPNPDFFECECMTLAYIYSV